MAWRAEWIWNGGEESPRNEWWCFRKTFEVRDGRWDEAQIALTADSRYVLYVNGERVGRGPVRSWPFEQSYDVHDIGHLLRAGRPNTIAVLVLHFGVSTFYYLRGRGGLLAQLDLREGGEPSLIAERSGGGLGYDLEEYHAARTVSSPEDLVGLGERVCPVPERLVSPDDVFTACIWVREREARPVPASLQNVVVANPVPAVVPLFEGADTEMVIDFGHELSGYLEFEVEAPDGTILDLYGFEYLQNGERQDTFGLDNTLRYVCREGRQQYTSPVRRGLRYLMVVVRGATGPVRLYGIRMLQSNYPVAEVGDFRCSDALLNEVWHISRHTTRLCMEDTFVDCPAYDQTYWVGDSRNEALVGYYVFGGEEIVKRCLRLVPGSKFQSPLYSDQVPSGWSSVIPNWTFFWVVACTEHYLRTGDLSLAREMWPHVRYTLDRYLEYLDDHGLLSIRAWNLLDWAPMDQPGTGVVTHQNAFLVRALRAATELADVVGDSAQSAAYAASAQRLKAAINDHLWSEERRAYLDAIHADKRRSDTFSMQTQVVAYLSDVAEEERAARIEGYLADPPSDFVRIGSPFMSFFHYEALTKVGKPEMMLDDIRENYGRMVEPNGYAEVNGLNICYERHGDGLPLVLLHGAFGTIESCFAGLLPELARYGRQDPHDNGPERIPERRDSRRALGRLAERIRAP